MALAIIIIGIALIAAATFGIYTGYSADNWTVAFAAWTALIIGALTTLFGFGKRVSDRMGDDDQPATQHAQVEIRALVQALGVVATADQKLEQREIETIARIHEDMLGIRITDSEIHEILSEFGPGFDIAKRLVEIRSMISPTMKRFIVQSCHLVMISDLDVEKAEESRIYEIGLALGFDQDEIDDLVATAGV